MASKEIEREVDDFANHSTLRRHSIMDEPRVEPNNRHYDRLWKQALRELKEVQFLENIL